jgi:hypothetical protein
MASLAHGSTMCGRCAPPTTGTCGSTSTSIRETAGALPHDGPAIARQFPRLDVLFVGAGTAGTLMGGARYFPEWHRAVQVIAVDLVGSVAFGGSWVDG